MNKVMGVFRQNRVWAVGMLVVLSGCSLLNNKYVPQLIKPHKTDIQQGNVITQQDVERLQEGMSKDQVRFILGTPLLTSPFHSNRWDYVYRLLKADGSVVQYRYTVLFENDKLKRHSGEQLPTNQSEFLTGADRPQTTTP